MKYYAFCHSPCNDGLSGAWIFSKYMTENSFSFELVAGNYAEQPESLEKFKDATVYFIDFTFKRDRMIELSKIANKIIIIDHHKTAEQDLKGLPSNVETNFDMNHSGAVLAWKYFYPDTPIPLFLQYVEDNDIYTHNLPGIKEFVAWLDCQEPRDVEEIGKLNFDFPPTPKSFVRSRIYKQGVTILQYKQALINDAIERAFETTLCGVPVVKVNSCLAKINSELGVQLVAKFGKPAWVWYQGVDRKTGKIFQGNSLRSNSDINIDVSEIAKQLQGGGHRYASGFIGEGKP